MDTRGPQQMAHSARDDNQARGVPRLPGASLPADFALPLAYIYQPARPATQGGLARLHEWVLEFEPWAPSEIEPLMGWTSTRDPFPSVFRLRFPDRQSAIAFAERQGWRYVVRDPPVQRFRPKSHADNFKYELAGGTAAAQAWDGAVSITDPRKPQDHASAAGGRAAAASPPVPAPSAPVSAGV